MLWFGAGRGERSQAVSHILSSVIDEHHWQYRQWLAHAGSDEVQRQADALAVRRDMITLLAYTRDNKVVGTQSTGNMPLKSIREVTAAFVKPPELDTSIGDHVYKLRTEFDIWPLYFLHIVGVVGELLVTPVGGRWRVTPEGDAFLGFRSLDQILHLLYVWWFRVNWAIAHPFAGLGEMVPRELPNVTLNRLHSAPVGRRVEFEGFADALAKRAGLTWNAAAIDGPEGYLRWAIRHMVIEVAEDFGVVEPELRETGRYLSPELVAFRVTPFGRLLLTGLMLLSSQTE